MFDLNQDQPETHSVVPSPQPAVTGVPQFSTAEYAHIPSSERCAACGSFIGGEYYRINNRMVCSACAARIQGAIPAQSHAAFVRGLLFGIGAAIVGLAAYSTFTIVTHIYLGYLALGVGWFIAKAMLKGSGGVGGRHYQIAAVLLTYAAISMSAIPIGISSAIQHKPAQPAQQASANPLPEDSDAAHSEPASKPSPAGELGPLLLQLLFAGIASPFLELSSPINGLIGLFILFIGLRIAWQMTRARAVPLDGPYTAAA